MAHVQMAHWQVDKRQEPGRDEEGGDDDSAPMDEGRATETSTDVESQERRRHSWRVSKPPALRKLMQRTVSSGSIEADENPAAREKREREEEEERVRAAHEQRMNLVKCLVPRTAIGYDQRVQALVERSSDAADDPKRDLEKLGDADAHGIAERILVDLLQRIRYDRRMLGSYAAMYYFVLYMVLFVVVVSLQMGVLNTDYTVSYRAVRDAVFG